MSNISFENYLRSKAIAFMHENWNCKECSDTFNIDYKNMCAYMNGRKELPLKLAFMVFDYLQCRVVVFRGV